MRKFLFPVALMFALFVVPATARASWLSEAIHWWRGDPPVVTYDQGYPYYTPGYSYYAPGYDGGYPVAPSYPNLYWSSPSWYRTYRHPHSYGGWHTWHGHHGHHHHPW